MSTKGLRPKSEASKAGAESSDFPVVCETCLGENPYVRMTKEPFGKECKVCSRPFTVFRWRPGPKARYKKTEVCQTCAKVKNVCQTCLLDLQFGLPTQVRDSVLPTIDPIPQSDVHREYFADQAQKKIAAGEIEWGKAPPSHALAKLARHEPYFKRNLPHVCSFFAKGTCTRGSECPYRHEKPPEESDLSHQNIKDRYYGVNDPVAKRILARAKEGTLHPPEDTDITTLYIGGVAPFMTDNDLRDVFYAYGEVKSIHVVHQSKCAFVSYTTRDGAEAAMSALAGSCTVRGVPLKVAWGHSSQHSRTSRGGAPATPAYHMPAIGAVPPAGFFALPPAPPPPGFLMSPASMQQLYPSMNPAAMGARPDGAPSSSSSSSETPTTSAATSTTTTSSTTTTTS